MRDVVASQLTRVLLDAVDQAGRAVLAARARGIAAAAKSDGSPVTTADLDSEQILTKQLEHQFPDIPVVSEEGAVRPADMPSRFFLVDPLDGTKEFIAGRDEFTVNVALVEDRYPVVGVIAAPALGRLIVGIPGVGAFERMKNGSLSPIFRQTSQEGAPLQILVSRSHLDPATERALAGLPGYRLRSLGSSLKFVLIATGEADLYIRFAPTMAWDTAAGQAVVEAADGVVLAENGARLSCSLPDGLRNPGFVAAASLDHARLVLGPACVSRPE